MGSSLTAGFVQAIREGDPFVPIPVSALRVDSVTGFDLYIELRPGDPLVLYARKDVTFNEVARQRLEDNLVAELYVDASDETPFRRYLERHLPSILNDPNIAVERKAEILYLSAQGLAREILANPKIEGGIDRGKFMVEQTIDFMLSQKGTLRHLLRTASSDHFAYTHSVNACVYSIALVQKIGPVDSTRLQEFGTGALLRDVGMSRIDRKISERRGPLSPVEFEAIKQHPILGENLLKETGELTPAALDVVRHHHEKIDGSGYPDGLLANDIDPFVRACTIADIFDALSTNRSHRKAYSTFDALRLMRAKMAPQLDVDTLRAFIELMGRPDSV